jgi:hypothetical protein
VKYVFLGDISLMKRALKNLQNNQRFTSYLKDFYHKHLQELGPGDYVGNDILFLHITNQALNQSYQYKDMAVKLVEASSYKDYIVGEFIRDYFQLKTNSHFEILKSYDAKMSESLIIFLLARLFDFSGLGIMIRMEDARALKIWRKQLAEQRIVYQRDAKKNVKKIKQHQRQQKPVKNQFRFGFFTWKAKPVEINSSPPSPSKPTVKKTITPNITKLNFASQVKNIRRYNDDIVEMKIYLLKGSLKKSDRATIRVIEEDRYPLICNIQIRDLKEWDNGYKPVEIANKGGGIYYIYFSLIYRSDVFAQDIEKLYLFKD